MVFLVKAVVVEVIGSGEMQGYYTYKAQQQDHLRYVENVETELNL